MYDVLHGNVKAFVLQTMCPKNNTCSVSTWKRGLYCFKNSLNSPVATRYPLTRPILRYQFTLFATRCSLSFAIQRPKLLSPCLREKRLVGRKFVGQYVAVPCIFLCLRQVLKNWDGPRGRWHNGPPCGQSHCTTERMREKILESAAAWTGLIYECVQYFKYNYLRDFLKGNMCS